MATVQAFIRVSTKKVESVNVRFRLRDGRDIQLFHKSELTISPDLWDKKNQCMKAKVVYDPNEKIRFNKAVADRKSLILSLYNERSSIDVLSTEWLEKCIDKNINPRLQVLDSTTSLLQYVSHFIVRAPKRKDKTTGRLLSFNNIQQYKATEKHLKDLAEELNVRDFSLEQIDMNFYDELVDYLQREIPARDENGKIILNDDGTEKLKKKSFTLNSVGKHIKILKLMLNEATSEGINTSKEYLKFKVFTEECDTVYLNEIELGQLKDAKFSESPHLERVRDWFLLLAWTGCRFSDLEKITKTDIKDGFITFRQQKTNNKVTIPLHPVVKEILEKYKYEIPNAISNQKFNIYIKEVAKQAGINSLETITQTVGGRIVNKSIAKSDLISSHTGRRSFCTNMYKRGLPTLMIMSISGHKTEKSFLKYIKVKQEEHVAMMADAWGKIYNDGN